MDMSEVPVAAFELSGLLLAGLSGLTPQPPVLPSPQNGLGGKEELPLLRLP